MPAFSAERTRHLTVSKARASCIKGRLRTADAKYVAGLIAGIVILVLVLVIWGHGIKWLSDTWGGSDAALVGAVLLGIVFVPVFFIIGLVTEVRHVVNRSASAR